MLDQPKEIEYWSTDIEGNDTIDPNAPAWAKQEFDDYQEKMKQSGKTDKNGITRYY